MSSSWPSHAAQKTFPVSGVRIIMKIVVVTEKPAASRALAVGLRARWPDEHIVIQHVSFDGPLRFDYARGIKWKDYPTLKRPSYRWEEETWIPGYELGPRGECNRLQSTSCDYDVRASLASTPHIVFACDWDYVGAMAFRAATDDVHGPGKSYAAIRMLSLEPAHLLRAVAADDVQFPRDCAELIRYGEAKRYFDFNFNSNALGVFGRTLMGVGLDPARVQLSKYALQFVYYLHRQAAPLRWNDAIQAMNHWKGTGRYSPSRLGSSVSQGTIIRNMEQAGIIETSSGQNGTLRLTPTGAALLQALHPDCEDPDLPCRVEAWCGAGLAAAQQAIDRYLRTFFGKQIRFLAKGASTA